MGNNEGIVFKLKYVLNCVLKVIYVGDQSCVICKDEYNIKENKSLCRSCEKKLVHDNIFFILEKNGEKIPCYCFNYYKSIMREMLFNLKYNRDFLCGEILAEYLSEIIIRNEIEYDYISFIPSSWVTLRKRGYNQSQVLAKYIGDKLNSKVISSLKKIKNTKDQIGLDGDNRWKNVQGAFKCRDKTKIKNKTIILVDDVITTGATIYNCVKELKSSGAKEVIILTVSKSKVF